MEKLSINNLYLTINKKTILKNISFNIEKGEIVAIIGKSGSGKSTLLESIVSLKNLKEGSIVFDGELLTKKKIKKFQKKIGYINQNKIFLDNITIYENLKMFYSNNNKFLKNIFNIISWEQKNKIIELSKEFGVYDNLQMSVSQISSGEYQRIDFIRTLLKEPEVFILDEPMSNMDNHYSNKILTYLKKNLVKNNSCAIVVLHNLDIFEKFNFDKVIGIKNNKIIFQFKHCNSLNKMILGLYE